MPINKYTGNAAPIAQVNTVTPASVANGATYTLTINGKTVNFVATATTVANVTAGLAAAVADSLIPEFQELVASDNTTNLTLTANTPGKPFTQTSSATSGTLTTAATIASSGPGHWRIAANWSRGVVPQSGLGAPTISGASAVSGGALTNGTTYYWVLTATNSNGETVASNEVSLAITTPNQTATIAWTAVPLASGYKLYRSTSSGTYGGTSLVTTITNGATVTFDDTGAALSSGTPPGSSTAAGDDVEIDGSTDLLYDLSNPSLALASLTIWSTFTGRLGLPDKDSGGYYDYRTKYLTILSATTISVGQGTGPGSSRIKIALGNTASTVNVYGTGASGEIGRPAFILYGAGGGTVLNVTRGSGGCAIDSGTSCTIATARIGFDQNPAGDVSWVFGAGCTLGTVNQEGGVLEIEGNVTTLNMTDGDTSILGAATVGTLNQYRSAVHYRSTGTLTTVYVSTGATLDFAKDMRARTVTNCTVYAGASLIDPFKTVTFTNGIVLSRCALKDVQLALGDNFTLTRS